GGTARAPEPVAEPLRGAAHRLGPAQVSGPWPRAQREAPTPCLDSLLRLLSRRSNSPLAGEGCAGRQAHRAAGDGHGCADPRSRWSASSLRPTGGLSQPPPAVTPGDLPPIRPLAIPVHTPPHLIP